MRAEESGNEAVRACWKMKVGGLCSERIDGVEAVASAGMAKVGGWTLTR